MVGTRGWLSESVTGTQFNTVIGLGWWKKNVTLKNDKSAAPPHYLRHELLLADDGGVVTDPTYTPSEAAMRSNSTSISAWRVLRNRTILALPSNFRTYPNNTVRLSMFSEYLSSATL